MDTTQQKALTQVIDDEIEALKTKTAAEIAEKEKIKRLVEQFPDLYRLRLDPKTTIYICTSLAPTDYEIDEGDRGFGLSSPLISLRPFTIIDGVRIYTTDEPVIIGEKSDDSHKITPENSWKERLESLKLPAVKIKDIEEYFADNSHD